jgi:hypothetical protein
MRAQSPFTFDSGCCFRGKRINEAMVMQILADAG